jgi:putative transposase
VEHAREQYEVSERRACRVVRQWRGTQRYRPLRRTDEDELTQAILALGVKYGRYGYRRITVLLRNAGWQVGKDRVQRIWRREGLMRFANPDLVERIKTNAPLNASRRSIET